jgi:hypothetical protein
MLPRSEDSKRAFAPEASKLHIEKLDGFSTGT